MMKTNSCTGVDAGLCWRDAESIDNTGSYTHTLEAGRRKPVLMLTIVGEGRQNAESSYV